MGILEQSPIGVSESSLYWGVLKDYNLYRILYQVKDNRGECRLIGSDWYGVIDLNLGGRAKWIRHDAKLEGLIPSSALVLPPFEEITVTTTGLFHSPKT